MSEERIAQLFQTRDVDQLLIVLKAMTALKDDRAVKFAIAIARDDNLRDIWHSVFKYLATIKSDE
jgi:hypothetical protein